MCGIAGILSIAGNPVPGMGRKLAVMNHLLAHRGPDGEGALVSKGRNVGLAHRRLSIIDLSHAGDQPMAAANGNALVGNGEIYNYIELRKAFESRWNFRSRSDIETILAVYDHYGDACVDHLRGMFAFALWDAQKKRLLCARDRFGIKPFYYTVVDGVLYFASEIKALLPFLKEVKPCQKALGEYLTFQYTLGEETLFEGVKQLRPGHLLIVENGHLVVKKYWDVIHTIDHSLTAEGCRFRLGELLEDSVSVHLRSDVPVASYLSGGVDSSLIALLAHKHQGGLSGAFHGKFTCFPGYDESSYAQTVAQRTGQELTAIDITSADLENHLFNVIYHLDTPVAGPGAFPQYMVSKLASQYVKVILGGQGGDELFGGYARYVMAYFEQCIRASIEGTYKNGNFIVTPESILPNLGVLREYKPLLKNFWKEGLFDPLDARYFRLVDRSTDMEREIDWGQFDRVSIFENFQSIFNNAENVGHEAYFDKMTHFDFKCLLPALLQVEDRMSMAHGIESRVPFLDHALVEFAATVPANLKFPGGNMKFLLKDTFKDMLPQEILNRRDKMGFPVPLKEWFSGELNGFVRDILGSQSLKERGYLNQKDILAGFEQDGQFSRKIWGILSLEIWHRLFQDGHMRYKRMVEGNETIGLSETFGRQAAV